MFLRIKCLTNAISIFILFHPIKKISCFDNNKGHLMKLKKKLSLVKKLQNIKEFIL